MRKLIVLQLLGAVAAGVIAGAADTPSSVPTSVAEFVSLATAGVDTDFEPLASPTSAISKGNLVVEGTLTDVVDGVEVQYPDPRYTRRQANSYVTLVITVTSVIDGDAGKLTNGQVYVELVKSPATTRAQLSAANPHPKVVAVLDDITTWKPAPDTTVIRPDAVPQHAPLYAAYTDGLWLQASSDTTMSGLGAHPEDLPPAWGHPQQVNDVSTALHRAAGR